MYHRRKKNFKSMNFQRCVFSYKSIFFLFKWTYLSLFHFQADGAEKLEEAKKDAEAIKRLQSLFKGLKFFVSREVPRESVVFVIRSCDGEVSWDSSIFPGATYDETDESITHQIVDRPSVDKQYLSRQQFIALVQLCTSLTILVHFYYQILHPTSVAFRLH